MSTQGNLILAQATKSRGQSSFCANNEKIKRPAAFVHHIVNDAAWPL
jgi:hypothetical protein